MKAEVIKVTPLVAKNLLEKNRHNRKISEKKVNEYVSAMNAGEWKENGESLVLDINGDLKDGQHRLYAVLEANKAFNMVLVTGVDPEIMHTIDVGKTRSLKDVLELNGIKNAGHLASIINAVHPYQKAEFGYKEKLTNSRGIKFYFEQPDSLDELVRIANKIYNRQDSKLLSPAAIGFYHYVISGYTENSDANNFLNLLCGIIVKKDCAASWIYRKMANAKINKIKLNEKWKLAMVIKAWNIYKDGNYPVKSMSFDIQSDIPKLLGQ